MQGEQGFFDKEISWLSFNERVLQEAMDSSVPIIERARFLGIYSANMDEFFQVRFAKLRHKALIEIAKNIEDGPAHQLLDKVNAKVAMLTQQFQFAVDTCFSELDRKHIHIHFIDKEIKELKDNLSSKQLRWLNTYFRHRILRHINPIILTADTTLAQTVDDDDEIYFLVALKSENHKQFALIEIPRLEEQRFIIVPADGSKKEKHIVLLDDVIHYFIDDIFASFFSYDSIDAYSIKLTRDAEFNINDELDQSFLDKMSKGLKQRVKGDLVRLVHDKLMPDYMLKFLRKSMKIKVLENLVPSIRYRHFKDFVKFPNLGRKSLEREDFKALDAQRFTQYSSVFSALEKQDVLLYYPYHKFSHFTEFVRQACYHPEVVDIKLNIYRVAKNSRIIRSLMEAVKNGKKVTVVVELKARFDEQANIDWAKLMKDAGIKVLFGIETLKIHSKLCLVTRKEQDKKIRYAHIGTGNFHENNARVYTDFSLFTQHKEICQEVESVFSFISHSYQRFRFNHLIVSPLTSRRRIYQLIDNEISHAQQGKKAEIIIKVNNLADNGLVNRLYGASQVGVKIKMIVRGMCTLIPNLPTLSENIKIISIVDQFLEHPRVMVFHNLGDKQVYISSADWMHRNMDDRVEVSCPIYDETLKRRILTILDLHFKDTVKARIINKAQDNKRVARGNRKKLRSQEAIYNFLAEEENVDKTQILNKG
ncbi:polyphosphate kinase 1 [Thalassotalea agarivorans]|uniref:Polyphosphate kinase n=1 Tax=Thalassotalea agarivorans TaxID=349064 RepID=A0A1H9YPY7_THASX|nr:polyphosphate kinase 1 [Thalassotalea agarivorans]SES70547.1 polyphosphate kinase [Thalassotalea agarivorans]